jgi:uncharacterized membrane protein affecting hemolysin expression
MENALKGHKAKGTRPFLGQFENLPIQRKMLVMTLLICGAVLCVAIVALFTFQVLNFRSNFQRDTATLAVIIANNSTAALAFNDEKTAAEIVRALEAKPSVVAASLGNTNGVVVAHFGSVEDVKARAQFPPGRATVRRRISACNPARDLEEGADRHALPAR